MSPSELESKILKMLDGELPAAEVAALEAELLGNVESRETYRKLARVHSALDTRYESRAVVANANIVPIDRIMARQRKRVLHVALGAAAALALVSVIILSLMKVPDPPIATFRTLPGSVFSLTHEGNGNEDPEGELLAVGSRLQLAGGSVEATFESGVRIVAEGTCVLRVLDDDRVALDQGAAWFEVPEEAVGFTVETRELTIVDLGTEFGVVASSTAPDEVHVFRGAVEVEVREHGGTGKRLVASQARRVGTSGNLEEIEATALGFRNGLTRSVQSASVTGWASIFDPQNNDPRFVGSTSKTASPVTTDAHQDCIAANFGSVTLADGDRITLTGTVTFDVALAPKLLRAGLFKGPAVAQDVGNPYVGIYSEAPTKVSSDLKFGSGAHVSHPFETGTVISNNILPGGGGVAANTPIEFFLSITRDGKNLDVSTSYVAGRGYNRSGRVGDLDILSVAPGYDYTFNTVGFLIGERLKGEQATQSSSVGPMRFSGIKVTINR